MKAPQYPLSAILKKTKEEVRKLVSEYLFPSLACVQTHNAIRLPYCTVPPPHFFVRVHDKVRTPDPVFG